MKCLCSTEMRYLSGVKTRLVECPQCSRMAVVTKEKVAFYSKEREISRVVALHKAE